MRRLLIFVVVSMLTACTPAQVARWQAARDLLGQEVADGLARDYLAEREQLTEGRPCPQWYDTAIEAGFAPEQWVVVSRLMRAESLCIEDALNRSGATGLMQVMPMWADDCGGVPDDLFEAEFNLACARHVWSVQGWGAWSTY